MVGKEDDNDDAEEKDGTEAKTHGRKTGKRREQRKGSKL